MPAFFCPQWWLSTLRLSHTVTVADYIRTASSSIFGKMIGLLIRRGMKVGVGVSAFIFALPAACLVLVSLSLACMWVLGLLSGIRLLLRLWNPRILQALMEEKRGRRRRLGNSIKQAAEEMTTSAQPACIAEMRLFRVHQYLQDQLDTLVGTCLAQQLHASDNLSLISTVHDKRQLPRHVGNYDWQPSTENPSEKSWLTQAADDEPF